MHLQFLLPDHEQLRLESYSLEPGLLSFQVRATQLSYECPDCHTVSIRVHSKYQRELADLPCGSIQLRLAWLVRRFFCDNSECERNTFVEQVPTVAARYARRTSRLHKRQVGIAFITGGEPGERLAKLLEFPVSPDTLLRMIRKEPESNVITPTILGVDDWAIRKGSTYGTILIDLETRRPVDLLEKRSADVLANWLKAHPGVKIISRDRSNEYAKGASKGAPGAKQVADRFHLMKNLREALQLFLEQNRHCLRAAGEVRSQAPTQPATQDRPKIVKSEPEFRPNNNRTCTKAEHKRQIVRQKRMEKYEKVMELYQQKTPIRAIARQLGLHRSTVHRYVDAGEFPEMAERRKLPVKLDPYLSYLEERWEAGCRNRLQLWREICERGFDGTHKLVYIWTKRKGYFKKGAPKSLEQQTPQPQMVRMKTRPWAASRAAWLLVLEMSDLKPEEVSALERMIEVEPLVDTASKLAHEFRSMLSNRQAEMLSDWMQRASKCGIEPLKSFVGGMKNDLVAISLAFSLPWSNGPTEGNVNRLKLIKRQMYGRANFDLLRRRVLGMPSAP